MPLESPAAVFLLQNHRRSVSAQPAATEANAQNRVRVFVVEVDLTQLHHSVCKSIFDRLGYLMSVLNCLVRIVLGHFFRLSLWVDQSQRIHLHFSRNQRRHIPGPKPVHFPNRSLIHVKVLSAAGVDRKSVV